jgi:hypothetical protein
LLAKASLEQISPGQNPIAQTAEFDSCWRTQVLENTWDALAAVERESGCPYFRALRLYSEHPEARSHEIATLLTAELQPERPFSADGIRQIVHRARSQFSDLLIDEIASSIESGDLDLIEQELATLELLDYCRSALTRRRG